jgi:hypothetical protein
MPPTVIVLTLGRRRRSAALAARPAHAINRAPPVCVRETWLLVAVPVGDAPVVLAPLPVLWLCGPPGELRGQPAAVLARAHEAAVTQAAALEHAGIGDVRIDTSGHSVEDVADEIIKRVGW